MALRSIWHHAEDRPPTTRQKLNRDAISALFWVILTALLGIIVLSALGALLRFGVWGSAPEAIQSNADEALSILGNIGSAAIGGLVGWLTRDYQEQKDTPEEPLPPEALPTTEASTTGPIEIIEVEEVDELDEFPAPDEIEAEEAGGEVDPDFVWPDEPDGDEDVDFGDEEVRA